MYCLLRENKGISKRLQRYREEYEDMEKNIVVEVEIKNEEKTNARLEAYKELLEKKVKKDVR